MTPPTIGQAYTVLTADNRKVTRTPREITAEFAVTWIKYEIPRGEVRRCDLESWERWAQRVK